ncbi:MAG TPA: N-acetyltransferase [candidate division WOR-3 bacterium]|uniref:N-acetyltransferase n=1 Tax=candidate division WOR-3 bacterium TaxID=2052148 RepID=A0A7V0T682_UNCW3|nr:N-acetyltransferase [candidate division WOR-3 bacterium]
MALELREVRGDRDLTRFIRLPYAIYRDDPNRVAPLESDLRNTLTPGRNPFWRHAERGLYLAERDGRPVGRIAAINDRNYNACHESSIGFFGFFECVDDEEVARALFAAAENWCREAGLTRLYGPANPSMNDECGLLIEPFDRPPVIKTSYNPPYYPALVEAAGYVKVKDLYAFRLDLTKEIPKKVIRVITARKASGDLAVRPVDLANIKRDLGYIKEVYNDAWSRNWDFAPMTEEEIDDLARQLRPIVEPTLCPMVFWKGDAAGIAVGLPDYNQVLIKLRGRLFPFGWLRLLLGRRRVDHSRLWALGVKRRYQHLGLGAVMYYEAITAARRLGHTWGEMSWILEDNESIIRPIRLLGGERYKTYRIYRREPALNAG